VAQKFFKVSSMEPVQFNCMIQLYRNIHVFWFLQNHLAILASQMLMQINSECGQYIKLVEKEESM